MCRLLFLVVCVLSGAVAALADDAPVVQNPNPKSAIVLDQYTPAPEVIAQAETLQRLVDVAKPTLAWNIDMLWVRQDKQRRFSFTFGTAQWVRIGNARPVWALLGRGAENTYEREPSGIATSDISNAAVRDLAPAKSQGDAGGGDYARILLRDRGYDLYEVGIESEWLGTGHPVEQRRLYVLHGPGDSWRFVGEGPSESSGKSGSTCSWTTTAVRANLTGDPNAPVVLEFHTTSGSALASSDAEPAYPSLDIHREAILDGVLPAKLRWASDPYVEIDKGGVTLDAIIQRYTYWVINDGNENFTDYAKREATIFRSQVEDRNPALRGNLEVGTVVQLPSRLEVQEHLHQ